MMGSALGSPVFPLEVGSQPELTTRRNAPLAKNPLQLLCGKALYSYEGKEPGDLMFNKGDVIILRHRVDKHWFHRELRGVHGFLPASYVQCLQPLPPVPPQGKALYDFEMKDQDQDQDCLTFTKLHGQISHNNGVLLFFGALNMAAQVTHRPVVRFSTQKLAKPFPQVQNL